MQDSKLAFINKSADQTIYGTGTLQTPRSPYQVMAGTVIPAALVTGFNSDLPGQIIATVTESVYDTTSGRYLLIPQGARLLGQYDSQVAFGQSRVLLVWNRIVMPDGSSIALDRLPGVDTAGYAGLEDEIDNHWGKLLAGAALSTLLGVSAELAQPTNDIGGRNRIIIATGQSAQDSVNQVGQQITRRNLNIQPTLTVRPGFPVRVIVNKDLILQPYQAAPLTANIGRDD
jgi:type IV secretion system protein VirB10